MAVPDTSWNFMVGVFRVRGSGEASGNHHESHEQQPFWGRTLMTTSSNPLLYWASERIQKPGGHRANLGPQSESTPYHIERAKPQFAPHPPSCPPLAGTHLLALGQGRAGTVTDATHSLRAFRGHIPQSLEPA